jgi:integrase
MGAGWGNDVGGVFTQPDGTPLYPQTITASFKRISLDLGLPTIGVHGLRHSSATMMISSGLSPKVVSQRLGHATVAITLDTYSHVLPAHVRRQRTSSAVRSTRRHRPAARIL